MNRRQNEGTETFTRLLDWSRGQAPSERLAAQLLRVEGFKAVDPSHPLGGPDGLKDIICNRDGKRWIGAAYFPRGQLSFGSVKEKLLGDLRGVRANSVVGLAFVTNQELRLRDREELVQLGVEAGAEVDLLHLERITLILNAPQCYGIRLEFLDIEMNREEQLAFIAARDSVLENLQASLDFLVGKIQGIAERGFSEGDNTTIALPLAEIKEFKSILDTIAGSNPYAFSYFSSGMSLGSEAGHLNRLRVPLSDLKAFVEILDRITGSPGLAFSTAVSTFTGSGGYPGHVNKLQVPVKDLQEYEATLDRIAAKLQRNKLLEGE